MPMFCKCLRDFNLLVILKVKFLTRIHSFSIKQNIKIPLLFFYDTVHCGDTEKKLDKREKVQQVHSKQNSNSVFSGMI